MSLPVVIFLFVVSILAILLNKRKTGLFFLMVTAAFCLLIGSGVLPYLLLTNLQQPFNHDLSNNIYGKRNAIIMLGASNIKIPSTTMVKPTIFSYSRIYKTASFYSLCKKNLKNQCTIILSGGDLLNLGKSEARASQEELMNLSIDPNDIVLEQKSKNTYKNAEYTSKILKLKKYDQVIVITSGIHMKRALLYFSNFGVYPKPAIADYISPIFSLLPQAYNFAITDFAIHEYIGIVRFHIYNFMGWNSKIDSRI